MNIKLLSIAFLLCLSWQSHSQELGVMSKNTDTGVKLKFIPITGMDWLESIKHGFIIERRNEGSEAFTKLTSDPLFPLSQNEWLNLDNGDQLYEVYANCISVAMEVEESSSMEQALIKSQKLENEYPFFFLLTTRVPQFSQGSGLEFTDQTAKLGETYEYRISVVTPYDTLSNLHSHYYSSEEIASPEFDFTFLKNKVNFQWPHQKDGIIVSYNLIRSVNKSGGLAINQAPLYYNSKLAQSDTVRNITPQHILYSDSLEENEVKYYALQGIDVWGELCGMTEWKKVRMPDLTPPAQVYHIEVEDHGDRSVTVKWNYQANEPILGYLTYVAEDEDGPYRQLNEDYILESEVTITDLIELGDNYFRIAVVDTSFNYSISNPKYFHIENVLPPEPPENVVWQVDSFGVVSLDWDDSKAEDIKGYVVLSSYKSNQTFVSLTPRVLTNSEFTDTIPLDQISRNRYYIIASVDVSFNYSAFSDTILVIAPDTISPAVPVLRKIAREEGHYTIDFIQSASEDVQAYQLHFYQNGTWVSSQTHEKVEEPWSINDDQLEEGSYCLTAIDSSGNNSIKSNVRLLKKLVKTDQDKFQIMGEHNEANSTYGITWPNQDNAYKYKIYKAMGDEGLRTISMTTSNQFNDGLHDETGKCTYKVVAINEKGQAIGESNLLTFKF